MPPTAPFSAKSVPPIPAYLLKLIAKRRIRTGKAIGAMVSIAVALAIATSFIVTAMTGAMVSGIVSRVGDARKTTVIIRAALVKNFLSWHVVSLAAAVVASVAISCVLAVAFVGRKKSLGVLKILGGTTRDLKRLLWTEALYTGAAGVPLGMTLGLAIVVIWIGAWAVSFWCFVLSAIFGAVALGLGVWIPMRLVRNASCAQLLNNRPVYAFSNPSCAKCGRCGGF